MKPTRTRAGALQEEKPPQWETRALQLANSPRLVQLQTALTQQGRPSTAKNKLK